MTRNEPLTGGGADGVTQASGPAGTPHDPGKAGPQPSRWTKRQRKWSRSDYHADPAFGSGAIRAWMRDRRLCWERYVLRSMTETGPTPAMAIGSAVHALLLEPDTATVLALDKRTKAGREAAEGAAEDAILLRPGDYDPVMRIVEAVLKPRTRAAVVAKTLIELPGRSELPIYWREGELDCKGLLDRVNDDGTVLEIKSTRDPSPDAVSKSCHFSGWHHQAAHYRRGMLNQWVKGPATESHPFRTLLIAIGNEPPYAVGVYSLDGGDISDDYGQVLDRAPGLIDSAMPELEEAYASLAAALASWDGESLETEAWEQEIQTAELPAWAQSRERSIYEW